jgi:hypothetical protein
LVTGTILCSFLAAAGAVVVQGMTINNLHSQSNQSQQLFEKQMDVLEMQERYEQYRFESLNQIPEFRESGERLGDEIGSHNFSYKLHDLTQRKISELSHQMLSSGASIESPQLDN